jgi:hypothetical protein
MCLLLKALLRRIGPIRRGGDCQTYNDIMFET